jgi:hypothetical protein
MLRRQSPSQPRRTLERNKSKWLAALPTVLRFTVVPWHRFRRITGYSKVIADNDPLERFRNISRKVRVPEGLAAGYNLRNQLATALGSKRTPLHLLSYVLPRPYGLRNKAPELSKENILLGRGSVDCPLEQG